MHKQGIPGSQAGLQRPLRCVHAQRRSCRPILREKWGTWSPRLLAHEQSQAAVLAAEELALCEAVWAFSQE